MNTSIDSVDLQNDLRSKYNDFCGAAVTDWKVLRTWNRPYSTVSLVSVTDENGPQRVIAKQIVDHPANELLRERGNAAEIEFRVLRDLADGFESVKNCSVPKPHFLATDIDTYLMSYVEGVELQDAMSSVRYLAGKQSLESLGDIFANAGRWLRHFQRLTDNQEVGAEGLEAAVEHCDQRLKMLEQVNDRSCPANLRSKVMRDVEKLHSRIRGRVVVAGCHGDFGTWNILVRDHEVCVLDFYAYRRDFVALDALNVLVNLENQKHSMTFSSKRIDFLREKFLAGYIPSRSLDLSALRICETLHRICSVQGALMESKNGFREKLRTRAIIKSNLAWLTGEQQPLLWPR